MTGVGPPESPLRRIAVVNRGEAAMRLINAVRELRHQSGADVRSIALHTAAERRAMFVREADEAVCIDTGRDPTSGSPYLDLDALERALVASGADSAWVGWGFVAERPEFAELCDRLGIVFIGPRPDVMRSLGDKIGAKQLAEAADVPVAAWSGGPVDDVAAAVEHAERIGYPLMIKASAGGGGRGIRRVERADELAAAFDSARSEGAKAFGDPTVFMERVIGDARHVEVQLIADDHGTVWAVGVRDCSLQRRNQKVIEESHCIALSAEQDAELRAAAVRLATRAGYTNAGTVEFLYQPDEQAFAFLEVNTRLQVEHPVTELTTGLDLVKLQLHVAAGGRLVGEPPERRGYAIEARLNAEDPANGFAPAPGTIESLTFPIGPGVRVDTGVAEGDVIPPEYDSMIAKVIAKGADRAEAIARLQRALAQTIALVDGGTTNKSFLLGLLARPEVQAGDYDTAWLDRLTAAGEHLPTGRADVALIAAALDVFSEQRRVERVRVLELAARGRPPLEASAVERSGIDIELRDGSTPYNLRVRQIGRGQYSFTLADDRAVAVELERTARTRFRVTINGERFNVVAAPGSAGDVLIEVDGIAHRFSRDAAGLVAAPAAALVVSVDVAPGDLVTAGERVAVVEAMKMEIGITAPISGRVADVLVSPNSQVVAGSTLVRIEPIADRGEPAGPSRPVIDFSAFAATPEPTPTDTLTGYFLGFDVSAADARAAAAAIESGDELGVLTAFADLASLTPEQRAPDGSETTARREHFNAYLRTLDPDREGLPAWYVERLERAVRHYRVDSLERSDDLERSLSRILVSGQRRATQVELVMTMLGRRLPADHDATSEFADPVEPAALARLGETLDRLIETTQRRHPAIASLARGIRYRLFDRPVLEQHRAEVADEMRQAVDELLADPAPPRRAALVQRLVDSPLPLMGVFTEDARFSGAVDASPLVDVLTRRYYRIRDMADIVVDDPDGLPVLRTSYPRHERTVHVLAMRARRGELPAALTAIAEQAAAANAPDRVVVDIYFTLDATDRRDAAQIADDVGTALDAATLPGVVRRIAVIATRVGSGTIGQFTFRRPIGGHDSTAPFIEDVTFRGLHPMIARRMQMWRLANFEIERLPSADDVFAFRCVAIDNPADDRLIAVAEVRDLSAVRDERGNVVALPGVDHALVGCLEAIRSARSAADSSRLEWNRVMLYVWPVVDFTTDEVNEIARRLTPLTEGLGIEQVVVSARFATGNGEPNEVVLRLAYEPGQGLTVRITEPPTEAMQPLDELTRQRIQTRRRNLVHPTELIPMLTGERGRFSELDLADDDGSADRLVAVDRTLGEHDAGVVVGLVSTPTVAYPNGIERVVIAGDPTKSMGSITEAECRRIIAALDLAAERDLPVEWFALSAGARIAMDSGSENLDWVARVLRRIVEHTQAGGEINVVVAGINVGAQPYWNAEATMLMHTSGVLVMTPESAMVLTGKQAIDYSGGVSAENNLGIGGYERIMGPNGESQYFAPTLAAATEVLFTHYALTYRSPGERWPARLATTDEIDRDVRSSPHDLADSEFATVGDIFDAELNPDRKKPFDIRSVMHAVRDADHGWLERWPEMADAEMAVVADVRLGGHAVSLIGIESRPLPRHGITPADGPNQWSAGTLFPLSSKKVARAINAASGRRPVVVLANLSGFDGSPESLRHLQLEYGAEIGRAIVNFDGPFVLCVVSRYHGGAFVVFSATLNDNMEVLAVEGSFASVIGGAPAAAVVFTRDVDRRTNADERVVAAERAVSNARPQDVALARAELDSIRSTVRNEKLGEVARAFDQIHSVERAREVGSVDRIIPPAAIRPELIAAIDRGLAR